MNPTNQNGLHSPPGDRRHGLFRKLALASVITTFALIVLGGLVRVTGSGLGCAGEWPLCDGSLIPPLTKEDIIEYTHRFVASVVVGPLIIATFLVAVFRYRRLKSVIIPTTVSVALLLAQGGLGGVTVLTELPGHIVAAHLALAQALLGCLILVAVSAYRISEPAAGVAAAGQAASSQPPQISAQDPASPAAPAEKKDGFPRLAAFAAAGTYVILLSGAYVTATPGALAACPQWPLCGGSFWPSTELQAIHMLHRVVAAIIGLVILYVSFRAFSYGTTKLGSGGKLIASLAGFGGALLFTQVVIGAVAIWTGFPMEIRLAHIALATAVWGIMLAVALLSNWEPTETGPALRQAVGAQGGGASASITGSPTGTP